ncbi:SET-domain-containing protein [Panus rudis PR-1116 ss-1]|nr:SET-domain-containing protein [Panus rudis PR-1116 ss-1]
MLTRWNGEALSKQEIQKEKERQEKGEEVILKDPRKAAPVNGAKKRPSLRPLRNELVEVKYEYDNNSTGPAPATSVLVLNLSPLSSNQNIRRHFSTYGSILSFEPQIDKATGVALGIVLIKYASHAEAAACVSREHGRKYSLGMGLGISSIENEELKVVFDGERTMLKAVMRELGRMKKRKIMEEKKEEFKKKLKEWREEEERRIAAGGTPTSDWDGEVPGGEHAKGKANGKDTPREVGSWNSSSTPNMSGSAGSRPGHPSYHLAMHPGVNGKVHSPLPPQPTASSSTLPSTSSQSPLPPSASAAPSTSSGGGARKPPPSLFRARIANKAASLPIQHQLPPRPDFIPALYSPSPSSSSTHTNRDRGRARHSSHHHSHYATHSNSSHTGDHDPNASRQTSRSPSPITRRPRDFRRSAKQREHDGVLELLAKNGFDHVTIDDGTGNGLIGGGAVREEDVRVFFDGFKVDKVLQDHKGWYVTFQTADSARRAAMVLNSGARTLANHSVNVTVHPPPPLPSSSFSLPTSSSSSSHPYASSSSSYPSSSRMRWTDKDMITAAEEMVVKELRAALEKDVMDRVVGAEIRRLVRLDRETRRLEGLGPGAGAGERGGGIGGIGEEGEKEMRMNALKGLSFRKVKKRVREDVELEKEKEKERESEKTVEKEKEKEKGRGRKKTKDGEPPRKKVKKTAPKKVVVREESEEEEEPVPEHEPQQDLEERHDEPDVESEDDQSVIVLSEPPSKDVPSSRKRAPSVSSVIEMEEPPTKKSKVVSVQVEQPEPPQQKKQKKATKKQTKTPATAVEQDEVVHEVLPDDLGFEPPAVTQVRFSPEPEEEEESEHELMEEQEESSPPPSRSVSPDLVLLPPPPPPPQPRRVVPAKPPIDPYEEGVCEDDEDLYYAKLALSGGVPDHPAPHPPAPSEDQQLQQPSSTTPPTRVHVTGSARTEGYYKISHAEKSAYVAQYASRGAAAEEARAEVEKPPQSQPTIISSRSNRANARRRAQGLEEINQVQRAMALSKGESAATELVKFNQLQTRKKHLRFARSPIHDWGLYAMEKISRGEMVIEYVGEVIRAQVADKREQVYERQGIGSSYLFRIDEDLVVDATKKGNLGCVFRDRLVALVLTSWLCVRRLINHSCDPNCTAKIITINGEKKIVIYAKQDIELGSEITYGTYSSLLPFYDMKLTLSRLQITTSLSNRTRFLVCADRPSVAVT